MRSRILLVTAMVALLCGTATADAHTRSKLQEIYGFKGKADGSGPNGVISDASGALYGTVASNGNGQSGAIFKLSPPSGGETRWTHSTLYTFTGGNDGAAPSSNLLADGTGAFYGTTFGGGADGYGVVFKLTPPAPGKTKWSETVLHTFSDGTDGAKPWGTLVADSTGNLYGTTISGGNDKIGTVFELSPPAEGQAYWTETILYTFTGKGDGGMPFGGLLFGNDGSLYGTAFLGGQDKYGTVYQLTPPGEGGGEWGFNVLHSFSGGNDGGYPRASLIEDSTGALYGDTSGNELLGTVFKLTKSGNSWTEDVLYKFTGQYIGDGPWQALSIDSVGALYGTTLGDGKTQGGTLFKLTPPAPGGTKWAETTLLNFQLGSASEFPYTNVLLESGGTLVGTSAGSVSFGSDYLIPGDVWEISQ
jgi:uncharacterized repeat protein (TIGR03803 family)